MSEISLPDIRLPDIRFRDAKLPDVKLPDIDLRERLPDVDLARLPLPAALRDRSVPELDLRSLDPRRLDLSGLDAKRLRALAPFAKPAQKPASPLPWILVAGAAGLFAGWFLATSPLTRGIVDRLRARIDAWRTARAGWEDAEERTEGFWSNEEGWQQQGAQPGAGSGEGSWEGSAGEGASWEGSSSAAAMGATSTGEEGAGGTGSEPPPGESGESSEREG